MIITRRRLTQVIRRCLLEVPLGLHGAGMSEDDLETRLGYGGIEIGKSGPVTDEEADAIAKKIATERPERIFAYSRGAAALNRAMQSEYMPSNMPPVTYLAPAALRGWTSAPIPILPGGSVTIAGGRDATIPIKQACQIANAAGTDLFIYPDKSHVGILYTGGAAQGAKKININACMADDTLPDWGTGMPSEDDIVLQQGKISDLVEAIILRLFDVNL